MEEADVSIFRFTPVLKERVINTEFFVTPTQMEKGKEREKRNPKQTKTHPPKHTQKKKNNK